MRDRFEVFVRHSPDEIEKQVNKVANGRAHSCDACATPLGFEYPQHLRAMTFTKSHRISVQAEQIE